MISTLLQAMAKYLIMMISALRRWNVEPLSQYQINIADRVPVRWHDMGNKLPPDTRIVAALPSIYNVYLVNNDAI
jgi:hypothetical protein